MSGELTVGGVAGGIDEGGVDDVGLDPFVDAPSPDDVVSSLLSSSEAMRGCATCRDSFGEASLSRGCLGRASCPTRVESMRGLGKRIRVTIPRFLASLVRAISTAGYPRAMCYGPAMTTSKLNPWLTDVRVRDRNIKKGLLDPKELEKYLHALTDVADRSDLVSEPQPALAGVPEAEVEAEVDDDEDDDDTADE